jgi:uncharacterized protein YggE
MNENQNNFGGESGDKFQEKSGGRFGEKSGGRGNWQGRMGVKRPLGGGLIALVWVATFLLFILAVTQIISWKTFAAPAPTATISVSGQGIAYEIPNIATFSVTVSEEAATVVDAQTKATADGNAVIDYLTKNDVASADIQTSDYSIQPKYQYESTGAAEGSAGGSVAISGTGSAIAAPACPPNAPCPIIPPVVNSVQVGYTVSETLTVKVRTVANAGTLLAGVGNLKVQNVSGLSFTVDNPETTQDQARDLAIKDAENQAQILAGQLGVRLVRVTGFSENGGPIGIYSMAASGANVPAAAPAPEVPAGQNEVTSNVTLTYEIQ